MTTAIATFIRNRETGAGEAGVTVEFRDHDTGSLLDSVTTDANGLAEFSEVEAGYPGQWYLQADDGTNTFLLSSKAIGQVGPFRAVDLIHFLRCFSDGVVDGVDGELACSADGTDMDITVQEGLAIGYGMIYWWPVDQTVTLSASDPSNPRIDRIVVRFYPVGTTDSDNVGKIVLDKLTGTPAASPSAPALTQSATTYWEISLAQVLVEAGVSTIAANKVTDERDFTIAPVLDGSITYEKIASADLGTGAGQLAIGDHAHTSVTSRGFFHDLDHAATATTTSTTNLEANGTVQAISLPVTLPTGTWTVQIKFSLDLKHSSGGRSTIGVKWESDEDIEDYDKTTDYAVSFITKEVTSVAAGSYTLTGRYCSNTSGTTSARNPVIEVTAWRTA
ncbi:MAG TPA: hypothetical protein VLA89_14025 [Gemmatimonadales bacterium]|nr:hypothetical protein [Gemmatimonadales bacterium]